MSNISCTHVCEGSQEHYLVEERQGLVWGQLNGRLQRRDVILLQPQAQQDGSLQV